MKRLLILNSGGRTSAYMTDRILKEYSDEYEIKIVFANTGWEHEKTLKFVNNCDKRWGNKVVWLEAVVNVGRVACTHKVVSYKTASRKQEPFEDVVAKYGISNAGYPHCTRELKENPIIDYCNSIGWEKGSYEVALGIRADEPRRIKRGLNKSNGQIRVYPLVDWFETDKLDVLDYWEDQDFDLDLPAHLGNCIGCFKKSQKKLLMVMRDMGKDAFGFPLHIESFYGHVGNNKINGEYSKLPRTMYRQSIRTNDMIALFNQSELAPSEDIEQNEGCASSCEAFTD